jgi:hypothetical protein
MRYDRTVSPALLQALGPRGPFGFLVDESKGQHLADLQLRAYPGKAECWATLYVGLTKVLDLHERKGSFWLRRSSPSVPKAPSAIDALTAQRDLLWNATWTSPRPAEDWVPETTAVATYVDVAIRAVAARFSHEGAVQAMLCTRASDLFSVVDREAVIGFPSTAARTATYSAIQNPLATACTDSSVPWCTPKSFGGELDLLAVDDAGRLLVIEVKPGSAGSGVTWAPRQAVFYASLFQAWADEVGSTAGEAILSMLDQRQKLGLTSAPDRPLQEPLEIVPIVAIGGGPPSAAITKRMWTVRDLLVSAHPQWQSLEVWDVQESVSRTVLDQES